MALCDMWPETMWTVNYWPLEQWPYCIVDILPIDGCVLVYCTNLISRIDLSTNLLSSLTYLTDILSRQDIFVDLIGIANYDTNLLSWHNLITQLSQTSSITLDFTQNKIVHVDMLNVGDIITNLNSTLQSDTGIIYIISDETVYSSVYNIVIDVCYDGNYQSCVLT